MPDVVYNTDDWDVRSKIEAEVNAKGDDYQLKRIENCWFQTLRSDSPRTWGGGAHR